MSIKKSLTAKHCIVFPHDERKESIRSKDIIPQCGAILADAEIKELFDSN